MDKIQVPCPECGTVLGVPGNLAGKKVRCSACKTVFGVPGAGSGPEGAAGPAKPKAAGAQKAAPPAGEREEEPEEPDEEEDTEPVKEREKEPQAAGRGGPRKGGGTGAGARAAGRKQPRRPGAGGAAGGSKKGGIPVPLIAGGALVLAAALAVVLVLALGGKDGKKAPDEPGKGEGKSESPKNRAAREEAEKRERYGRLVSEAETWEQWFRAGCLAEELGLKDEAKDGFRKALDLALEEEADAEKVYLKLGYGRYSLPEIEQDLKDDPSLLGDLLKLAGSWLSPEDLKKAQAREQEAIRSAREELARRKSDPFYARLVEIQKKIDSMKGFSRLQFARPERDPKYPYIIFEHVGEKGRNPYRSAEAVQLQAEKMFALKHVYDFMNRTFMEPMGYSPPKDIPLVVVSLEDREAFETYNKEAGMDLPPGAAAYFHRITGFIVMNNGRGGSVYNKEEDDSTLFHEATHQILFYFSQNNSGQEAILSHWFNEGCAEYVGQIRETQNPDGSYSFTPAHKMKYGRLRGFYMARYPEKFQETRAFGVTKPFAMSLEQMVQCVFMPQTTEIIKRNWVKAGGPDPKDLPADQSTMLQALFGGLIYCQAPSFFFFCYKGKPEYAPKMNDYFRKEMERKVTYRGGATFKQCFGIEDFSALEKEWLDYVESITTYEIKQGH